MFFLILNFAGIICSIAVAFIVLQGNESSDVSCFVWQTVQIIFAVLAQSCLITLFFFNSLKSQLMGSEYILSKKPVLFNQILSIVLSLALIISLIPWIINQCQNTKINEILDVAWKIALSFATIHRSMCLLMCCKWYVNRMNQVTFVKIKSFVFCVSFWGLVFHFFCVYFFTQLQTEITHGTTGSSTLYEQTQKLQNKIVKHCVIVIMCVFFFLVLLLIPITAKVLCFFFTKFHFKFFFWDKIQICVNMHNIGMKKKAIDTKKQTINEASIFTEFNYGY